MYAQLLFFSLLIVAGGVVEDKQGDAKQTRLDIAVFEYPPLYHTSTEDEFSGIIGETVKQICLEAELDCHFRMRPVSRAYQEIERGIAQALITVQFDRFNKCCIKSDWSYPWRSGLFSKHPVDQIPTSLAELTGQSLILIEGWQSPYSFFKQLPEAESDGQLTVHRANTTASSLLMLQNDRANFLWGGEEFFLHMELMKMEPLNFIPLLKIPMVVWFSDQEPELRRRFNMGFRRLQAKALLNNKNVLIKSLMDERYQAPLLPQ